MIRRIVLPSLRAVSSLYGDRFSDIYVEAKVYQFMRIVVPHYLLSGSRTHNFRP